MSLYLSWFYVSYFWVDDEESLKDAKFRAFKVYVDQERTSKGFEEVWEQRTTVRDPESDCVDLRQVRIDVFHDEGNDKENIHQNNCRAFSKKPKHSNNKFIIFPIDL